MVHTVYFFVREDSLQNAKHRFPKIVQTITFLQLGLICFFTLQTVYTNRERRHAVSQIKKVGKQKFCIENLLPDFNF